jgi:hypothetical protein
MTRSFSFRLHLGVIGVTIPLSLMVVTIAGSQALAAPPTGNVTYSVGPISDVSSGCPGTGDIDEAVDNARNYVYQEFEGCDHGNAVGFSRSTDGGVNYSPPAALPYSRGGWDPWLAVAPDGTLYAAFMNTIDGRTYPIVDVSHDFGVTFQVEQSLRPAKKGNWGDADYIAVSPAGTLYVAWGYGPSNLKVRSACSPTGSCWASRGDVNVAVQSSTNDGQTFSPISIVNPGYPDGGADEGDIVIAPDGAIDVLYQDYQVVNQKTLRLANGHEFFTTSSDGGQNWSTPVEVGASAGQITISEWWNDGTIAADPAGNLYATWDTQGEVDGQNVDIGWVSFSTDGGSTWSTPIQAPPDDRNVPHIMEVTGASPGVAYVAWLSSSNPSGYAMYLRTFSIGADSGDGGWLSDATQISQQYGDPKVFPGDTFGIATFSPTALSLSWGSAVPGSHKKAAVFTAPVAVSNG